MNSSQLSYFSCKKAKYFQLSAINANKTKIQNNPWLKNCLALINSLLVSSFVALKPQGHTELHHYYPNTQSNILTDLPLCSASTWTCPRLKVPLTLQTHTQYMYTHKETLIAVVPVSTTSTELCAGIWWGDRAVGSGQSWPWVTISYCRVCWL